MPSIASAASEGSISWKTIALAGGLMRAEHDGPFSRRDRTSNRQESLGFSSAQRRRVCRIAAEPQIA